MGITAIMDAIADLHAVHTGVFGVMNVLQILVITLNMLALVQSWICKDTVIPMEGRRNWYLNATLAGIQIEPQCGVQLYALRTISAVSAATSPLQRHALCPTDTGPDHHS